jgi:metal-responsive CopG/Arc/MetJ family transcriptional regulator
MIRVMPNPRSVEKITFSLPAALLRDIERLRRETGETRSAFIRRSIKLMLGRTEHAEMVRGYVAGYHRHRERPAEIDAAMTSAAKALVEEPWE